MAFRRRKLKCHVTGEFIKNPVTCYFCKSKKAFTSLHGHYRYGGLKCCDDCFPKVQKQVTIAEDRERNYHMTEADYQTWGKL